MVPGSSSWEGYGFLMHLCVIGIYPSNEVEGHTVASVFGTVWAPSHDATFGVTSDFFHQVLSTVCYERACTEHPRRIQPGNLLFKQRILLCQNS